MDEQTHLKSRKIEKDDAMAAIWQAVNTIETECREPDLWERLCITRALQGIFSGCYVLALAEARLSMIPPDQHVTSHQLPSDSITDRADLPFLSKVAKAADEEPVRRFPQLGPIMLISTAQITNWRPPA